MFPLGIQRLLHTKLSQSPSNIVTPISRIASSSSSLTTAVSEEKGDIPKGGKGTPLSWEYDVVKKLNREYDQSRKHHSFLMKKREIQAISINYITSDDIKHLFGIATTYANLLNKSPDLIISEEYFAVVLKYASVIFKQDFAVRTPKEWKDVVYNLTKFLSKFSPHNDISAIGYLVAYRAFEIFWNKYGTELDLLELSVFMERCKTAAEYAAQKYDLTAKQLLFDYSEIQDFIPKMQTRSSSKDHVSNDSYDPNLSLVSSLRDVAFSGDYDSPFVINQRSKTDYIQIFEEQLNSERGGFMKVENFTRDPTLPPVEEFIKKWRWEEQIAAQLRQRAKHVQDSIVKQCLSNIDIDKSAKGMLEVVKAELSQGQAHIGIRGIENALADSVLSGLYNRFIDKIDVSAGEITREVFQQFMEYFSDHKLAQIYTALQWWNICCTSQKVDPLISLPCVDFKLFLRKRLGGILSDIVLSACTFESEGRFNRVFTYCNVMVESDSLLMNEKRTKVGKMIRVNSSVMKILKENEFKYILFPHKLLPLRVPPRPWIDFGKHGPFYTYPTQLIRRLEDFIDIDVNKEFQDRLPSAVSARPVFDALNDLGSTPWIINGEMLDLLTETFKMGTDKTQEELLSKLRVPLHTSTHSVPDFNDVFGENVTVADITSPQWRSYYKDRSAALKTKLEMNSLWCWLRYRVALARHYRNDVLFFPHNMDFRGRVYPISPHLNHMGDDINRCILKFAKGKRLGERGLYWLKLHIINITGLLKKKSIDERIKYFEENVDDILDSANNPLNGRKWWLQSDDPWQTLAACKELRDAFKLENPEDFVSHLPIHQDGSCNGLQHYAALGRDRQGALEVNLCPSELPADIYSSVAARVEEKRIKDEEDDSSKHHEVALELRAALPEVLPRKVVKQTVMTTVYGVTNFGARQQIKKQLKALGNDGEESAKFAKYLTEHTFTSLNEAFETSMKIKDWLRTCATVCVKLMKPVEWTTPLGMPVMQPYLAIASKFDKICRLPLRHKQVNAFPPNYVHSLDSTHMMLTALHAHKQGITFAAVHDCYWTHASTVDTMNKICREQFVNMYSQPLITQLAKELQEQCLPPKIVEKMAEDEVQKVTDTLNPDFEFGKLDINEVKKSVYFFS